MLTDNTKTTVFFTVKGNMASFDSLRMMVQELHREECSLGCTFAEPSLNNVDALLVQHFCAHRELRL